METSELQKQIIEDKIKIALKKEEEVFLRELKINQRENEFNEHMKNEIEKIRLKEEDLRKRENSFEIAFVWDVKGENARNRSNMLNKKLFGQYIKKKLKNGEIKTYFIDGILIKKDSNGNILEIAKAKRQWGSCFSIPLTEVKFRDNILKIFEELKIAVTVYKLVENDTYLY